MRKKLSIMLAAAVFVPAALAFGYPNGTVMYVTDTGPFCASCHSAAKAEYMPELEKEAAQKETAEFKHYGLVMSLLPSSPYAELAEPKKQEVIKTARAVDSNSTVSITGPAKAKPGEEIRVVVRARGGNGPAIAVMLVDRALRFQARPVSSDGWAITGEPLVRAQDGAVQNKWLDRRMKGLKRNLSFVTVFDQTFDLEKGIFPLAEVTYTLMAPRSPGAYTLAAAFLYGTENPATGAAFQRPSGRILFSDELKIQVEGAP